MSDSDQSWKRLSDVAVNGAEYNSRERQPHPKCLPGTRVNFLGHINGLLDDGQDGSRVIWVHGTAGVGKSAVAFTIADRMRDLKLTNERPDEKRLAGTFFFSRKYTNRCTTGYFFATLVYQLAINFPSIQEEVSKAINKNPSLLDPDKSLRDQVEALFLRPLRRLRPRLLECPPLVFVVDALDECTSEAEMVDLISLLGKALRDSDLPVTHILLTSRSEAHIREGMQNESVRQLVREIPVITSGEGITSVISLDGADVDSDICVFLRHSFTTLRDRYPNFPQPTQHELERLASRAGRRFIVASTMMKFIDDGYNDPHGRLQLMLELTSKLLPGTEVFVLYDRILSTCADPQRVYLHLSVVATLANPLTIPEISELLGPGEGRDVDKSLVQLRSVVDIPADPNLPVSIYHSSVSDYVSNPSHCGLVREQSITPAHSLLARSSFSLMIRNIPETTGLLDALLELQTHSQAMESRDPCRLVALFAFTNEPLSPLGVLMTLLLLRGDRSARFLWLDTFHGKCWLDTPGGQDWLRDQGLDWLQTRGGRRWLEFDGRCLVVKTDGNEWQNLRGAGNWLWTEEGRDWVYSSRSKWWMQLPGVREWLGSLEGENWLSSNGSHFWDHEGGKTWLNSANGLDWLDSPSGRKWLQSSNGNMYLESPQGRRCLQSLNFTDWLRITSSAFEVSNANQPLPDLQHVDLYVWLDSPEGKVWLQTPCGYHWLRTSGGQDWLLSLGGQMWLPNLGGQLWLLTWNGREWLETQDGKHWLQSQGGRKWMDYKSAQRWLHTDSGIEWLQTESGREWLQTESANTWLDAESGREWLQTNSGLEWLQSRKEWLKSLSGTQWLMEENGKEWLRSKDDGHHWLKTWDGREWLTTEGGKDWLETANGKEWLETESGQEWLETESGQDWLEVENAEQWLKTKSGKDWLETESGQDWLETVDAEQWLKTESGQDWRETESGRVWLETKNGREWRAWNASFEWLDIGFAQVYLQTRKVREWLETESGRERLGTSDGRKWLCTDDGYEWLGTSGGQGWLMSQGGDQWLRSCGGFWLNCNGQGWLETRSGKQWLNSQSVQDWLQTPEGQSHFISRRFFWLNMQQFLEMVEAITQFPDFSLLPAFRAVQLFKSLPDFLMFPAFLALSPHCRTSNGSGKSSGDQIIHTMEAFVNFADEARKRSRSSSNALSYACQNWAMHLLGVPSPWDNNLEHLFKVFWNNYLLSWLERLWCLKGLRSCLTVLSQAQRFVAKEHVRIPESSETSETDLMQDIIVH